MITYRMDSISTAVYKIVSYEILKEAIDWPDMEDFLILDEREASRNLDRPISVPFVILSLFLDSQDSRK